MKLYREYVFHEKFENGNDLKILSSQKEGGRDGYHSNLNDFAYNRQMFFGTLKGLIF